MALRPSVLLLLLLGACFSPGPSAERVEGQEEFLSAAPNGAQPMTDASRGGLNYADGAPSAAGEAAPKAAEDSASGGSGTPRAIEETDLYRIDGNRLYYLNGYRGLMVFDISNIDDPKLLGRSAIFGSPVEMVVRNGVASVVVADWYGKMDSGEPFRGSIVRRIDATDPSNIQITGEAKLGGYVRDVRIVGDVLYAVSQDYGWSYGWYSEGDVAIFGYNQSKVLITSVRFAGGPVEQKTQLVYEGYAGVFNVTPNAILLARSQAAAGIATKTELTYVDITNYPAGLMRERGKITVSGSVQGWGVDNGRFNIDFSDGRFARMVGCTTDYCGGTQGAYILQIADFLNPDAPVATKSLVIDGTGWSIAARFDGDRLYLAPSDGYYGNGIDTPIKVYDLSVPTAPKLAGDVTVPGNIWLFMPSGTSLFALGSSYQGVDYGSKVTVHYLDVTNAAAPLLRGTSAFGEGWAWTPAAGTFKAFTLDPAKGMVVLPFSGWSYQTNKYNNGLQLIEFDATTITTRGTANTKGWTTRGVFANGRLLSMSDLSLAVVNYDDRMHPTVTKELTLARNVIDTQAFGDKVAHLSTDWWDYDTTASELRVLPRDNADESKSLDAIASLELVGTNARLYKNGDFAYVVTDVRKDIECSTSGGGQSKGDFAPGGSISAQKCYAWTQRVTVVDFSTDPISTRGSAELPNQNAYGWGWGFYGCYYYDWWSTSAIVQVQGDALAFRRWSYSYDGGVFDEAKHSLFIVDLKNPDAPSVSNAVITRDTTAWWGNLIAVGDKLYATDYQWIAPKLFGTNNRWYVRYFLNEIDLSNRKAPRVGARINTPGIVISGNDADPSTLYTIDYNWANDGVTSDFSVVKINGGRARLLGHKGLDGYTGNIFVRGTKAYASRQDYNWLAENQYRPRVRLIELDLENPANIGLRATSPKAGWGWLVAVEGDRAVLQSGWGGQGIDLYHLHEDADPSFDETVRTRGYWQNAITRDENTLFLSSGYWGVQVINLD